MENVNIYLPDDLTGRFSKAQIANTMLSSAMNRMEYYRIRCVEMEERYGLNSLQFKELFLKENKKIFCDRDDFTLWQGYCRAFEEWKNKCEALRSCFI